jgi:hypothetical protein
MNIYQVRRLARDSEKRDNLMDPQRPTLFPSRPKKSEGGLVGKLAISSSIERRESWVSTTWMNIFLSELDILVRGEG